MKRMVVAAALALAACGQGGAPAGQDPTVEAPAQAPPSMAAVAPENAVAADAVRACFLTGAQVSAALGGSYQDGVESAQNAPYLRSCNFRGSDNDGVVSAYWVDPAMPVASVSATLGPSPEAIAGDADGAYYDPPIVTGGCTLAYRRANVTYTIQIMQCRSVSDARARLLALPRP